ncbi:MAG: type II toxin-antitoxin system PemK/MazF family toxin, partial [Pyrinomonadaceae bacterium]
IVSPDEMNSNVNHVLIAPISSASGTYPTRIPLNLLNSERFIILDQLRTIENGRLVKKIAEVDAATQKLTLDILQEFFAA